MFTMFRSTAALGASLALAATALMPQVASAAQTMSVNHSLYASDSFALETSGHGLKNVIHCGPGSSALFTPCEDIKRFCALLGGDYEPGSCTTPDFPPPPSRD